MSRAWPREFTATVEGYTVRAQIIGRDTPQGMGRPRCLWCGQPVPPGERVHHLLYKGRGGDGRPSNGAVLHDGCHLAVHLNEGGKAAAYGLARSQYPHPAGLDPYAQPVRCAWRGWIVLTDEWPWQREAEPEELLAWYTAEQLAVP